jgi:preprotein translocase subunit SecG
MTWLIFVFLFIAIGLLCWEQRKINKQSETDDNVSDDGWTYEDIIRRE